MKPEAACSRQHPSLCAPRRHRALCPCPYEQACWAAAILHSVTPRSWRAAIEACFRCSAFARPCSKSKCPYAQACWASATLRCHMSMLALVAGRGVRGALAELQHRPRRPATESFYFLCYYLIVFYVGFYIMFLFGLSLNDVDVASWRIMVGCRPTNPHWTCLARPVRSREHSWRFQIHLHLFVHLVASHKVFDGPPCSRSLTASGSS